MRIGLDGRFYRASTGGIGRYTRELIKYLLEVDAHNEYVLFLTPADVVECNLEAPNLKKVVTEIKHFTFAEQLALPSLLRQHNLDLVHFLNFNHPIGYNEPFITTIHDLTMNFFPVGRQKTPVLRQAYLYVMRHAATASKAVIVPTDTVKKDVVSYLKVSEKNIKTIYEGVEFPSQISLSQKIQLKDSGVTKPYILFVSQWRPHKGLGVLVEAFNIIKKTHDIQLVVTGKANDQFPEIPQAINESPFRNDIITPGFVDDAVLDALYAQAKLFVFPSWYEGFGLPPLEAMARGVAVAASNTSVMPEVLGDAAAYFDPRDPQSMAKTIARILDAPSELKALKLAGLRQAKKYSWKKMAEETLALYQDVVSQHNEK